MSRPGRCVLTAGALALGLLAGCSDGAASVEEASSPAGDADEAGKAPPAEAPSDGQTSTEAQHVQVPSVWVLDAPSGFQTHGPAGPGKAGQWKELLSAEGGCTLAARGDVADKPAEEMRSASVELLQSVAEADDAEADAENARDVTLVSSGAGEGNEPKTTLTFVSADWATGDATVRGASRVMNVQNFDGSKSSESLTIRFSCPGAAVDEDAWEAVTQNIRPVLHSGSSEDDPWASQFTSPEAD